MTADPKYITDPKYIKGLEEMKKSFGDFVDKLGGNSNLMKAFNLRHPSCPVCGCITFNLSLHMLENSDEKEHLIYEIMNS